MIRKQLLIDLQENIFEKLEAYAMSRGYTVDEAARVILGESLSGYVTKPSNQGEPMTDMLYTMMECMGMATCRQCTAKLTAEEIKKNKSLCFKCKPDLDKLYDGGSLSDEDKK